MRFTVREKVPFAPERVFAAERDELDAIVPFLIDVERVTLRSASTSAEGDPVQVHRWTGAARSLPAFVRPMVRPELLTWEQTTLWSASTLTATWSIAVPAMGDAVEARGTRLYRLDEARACAVVVDGEITFRGTPGGAPPSAAPFVERFVVGLVVPMVGRTTVAVGRYLEQQGRR